MRTTVRLQVTLSEGVMISTPPVVRICASHDTPSDCPLPLACHETSPLRQPLPGDFPTGRPVGSPFTRSRPVLVSRTRQRPLVCRRGQPAGVRQDLRPAEAHSVFSVVTGLE